MFTAGNFVRMQNRGGYTIKKWGLHVRNPDGTDHPDVNSHNHLTGGSGTDQIALVDAHLRDGSTCTIYVDIEAGRHNVTGTSFEYNSENGTSADYKATGTTQAPHLHGPSDGY